MLGWIGFVLFWGLLSRIIGEVRLPGPIKVGTEMWDIIRSGLFVEHFLASIGKVLLGFVFAVAFGTLIGFSMGRSVYWKAFFKDTVMVAGSVPGLAYAVMALLNSTLSKQRRAAERGVGWLKSTMLKKGAFASYNDYMPEPFVGQVVSEVHAEALSVLSRACSVKSPGK